MNLKEHLKNLKIISKINMVRKNNYIEEERDLKFDARLRYVENVMDAWIVFVQADTERKVEGLVTPKQQAKFQKSFLNLFSVLQIHDPDLKEPEYTEEFYQKLKKHNIIKNLTDNAVKKDDPNQAIRNKFKV